MSYCGHCGAPLRLPKIAEVGDKVVCDECGEILSLSSGLQHFKVSPSSFSELSRQAQEFLTYASLLVREKRLLETPYCPTYSEMKK